MPDRDRVQIHQTLHGYSDGHRLLANSLELTRATRHTLLELSDMSGRSMIPGFEEYLTGYPLPESDLYAFAKTWYAPESKRPGCVWTHTLLLDLATLDSFRTLSVLCAYFRRPEGSATQSYAKPLAVSAAASDGDALREHDRRLSAALLAALYAPSSDPVLLAAPGAQRFEALVMSVWSQQWRALRSAFRFCTGAISPRMLGGESFDLQVIPPLAIREAKRITRARILDPSDDPEAQPPWMSAAVSDLYGETEPALRHFFALGGELVGPDRGAFAPLAELWTLADSAESSADELLYAIVRRYPSPAEGRFLKRFLFSSPSPLLNWICPGKGRVDILRHAATMEDGRAFDPHDLALDEIGTAVWREDRASTLDLTELLMRGTGSSSFREELLLSLVRTMSVEDALEISQRAPSLGPPLLQGNPTLATDPRMWTGRADLQRELFVAAMTALPEGQSTALIVAMLAARSDAAADQVLARFGPGVGLIVASWFDSSDLASPRDLPDGWRRVLTSAGPSLLDWLASIDEPREATAALVADLLNPHDRRVHRHGSALWLRPYRTARSTSSRSAILRLRAFELALGFENPGPHSDALVVRSFGPVYEALAAEELDYASWAWIEDGIPTLAWWKNWDKCERVRRALIDSFVDHRWPIAELLKCAPNQEVLRQLLESCRDTKNGGTLLHLLSDALSTKGIVVAEGTLQVLRRYL